MEAFPGFFSGGRVCVDGVVYPVARLPGGWYRIEGPSPGEAGEVRYGGWRNCIAIVRREGAVEIRVGWARGSFEWRGRTYVVSWSFFGRVRIDGEMGPVAMGRSTWHGFVLEGSGTDLSSILRELAFGLALKANADAAVATAALLPAATS